VPEERRGWERTCVWRVPDCKNVSSCGTSLSVGARRVFRELLTVFHCSVSSFGTEINFHREYNPRYVTLSSISYPKIKGSDIIHIFYYTVVIRAAEEMH
jgi:hypothetical protein